MVLMQQTFKESGKYAFDHKPNCVYSSSFVSGCPGTVVIYEILFGWHKKPMIEKSFEQSFANIIEFSVANGGYIFKKHSFSA